MALFTLHQVAIPNISWTRAIPPWARGFMSSIWAGLDGSDRLDVAKGLLGRPDGSETPSRTEQPLRSGTIALDVRCP